MHIEIIGSTNGMSYLDEYKIFAGTQAGICYMPDDYNTLQKNPEAAIKRFDNIIKSRHNSVLEHCYITFLFENCSKAFAMLLNSIRNYNTSEKSGRYTVMSSDNEIYNKWTDIFTKLYADKNMSDSERKHAILENARYVLSVFTPGTTFAYTVSLRTANKLYLMITELINNINTEFMTMLKPELEEFNKFLEENCMIPGFNESYHENLNFFENNYIKDIKTTYSEVYATKYMTSFVSLAQAERHRVITYKALIPDENKYYIPEILRLSEYEAEWIKDLMTVKFPQAQLIQVLEMGNIDNFLSKCTERLCGAAMPEIRELTQKTLAEYYDNYHSPKFDSYIDKNTFATKCKLTGHCVRPCNIKPEISRR